MTGAAARKGHPEESQLQQALAVVADPGRRPPPAGRGRGVTSDLSIDEVLLLHSASWEPAGVVFGVSWWSIPWGAWQWQRTGEVQEAATAFSGAFGQAAETLRREAAEVGGTGVVGVQIDLRLRSHHMDVALTGTAVRPVRGGPADGQASRSGDDVFLSDLSARDFVLLDRAGWQPLDVVAGASFVMAPRRSARQWAAQQGRNTELTNLTTALYQAREAAMETMQQGALAEGAEGVVNVKLDEGPLGRSSRVVQFVAVGTAVRVLAGGHRSLAPELVVPLDERLRLFEATSLRGAGHARGSGGRARARRGDGPH